MIQPRRRRRGSSSAKSTRGDSSVDVSDRMLLPPGPQQDTCGSVVAERSQPPEVVDEGTGRGASEGGVEDLADDDVVVPGVAHPVGAALEPALRVLDEGGTGERAGAVLYADELAEGGPARHGEPLGGDPRGAVEQAHRPGVDLVERLADPRVGVDAEEQHGRAERDGGDRGGGHREVRGPVAQGDDGDPGGEALHGRAVALDELLGHRRRPSANHRRGRTAAEMHTSGAPKSQMSLTSSFVTRTSPPGRRKAMAWVVRTTASAARRRPPPPAIARAATAAASTPARPRAIPTGHPSSR